MKRFSSPRAWHIAITSLCLSGALENAGISNPAGPSVQFGDISFVNQGSTLQIYQGTQNGVINWNTFSIQPGETTQFIQPNSNSATLNRVLGTVPSYINGNLFANGQVFLLNSNGILVGRQGVIDVGGFTASTLELSDEDFLNRGDMNFRGNSQASVVNLGQISASDGDIFLIGAEVLNAGSLNSRGGTVGLAAGDDVLIAESGNERVFVRGASGLKKENGVINQGTIDANVAELKSYGGNIYGMAVKNEGRVAATTVTREGGQIFLRASGGSRVSNTGSLKATQENDGGSIMIDSGELGETKVGGTVDAGGSSGIGGEVVLMGGAVTVTDGAEVLADGDSGGGAIYIGGGRLGEDDRFGNATSVSIGNGARLDASARLNGDGGQVITFAEKDLTFFGRAEARGGQFGGDGGFVELSGQESVLFPGFVRSADVSALNGKSGKLLFDPNDINVVEGGPDEPIPAGEFVSEASIGSSPINFNTIYADDVSEFLQEMGDLEIVTSGTGGSGILTVEDGVDIFWSTDNSLLFNATNQFISQSDVSVVTTGNGAITIFGDSMVSIGESDGSSATFQTAGGALTIYNSDSASAGGVQFTDATLKSGMGNIEVTGYHAGGVGVSVGSADIETMGGDLKIGGFSGGGNFDGIKIETSAAFNTELDAKNSGTVELVGRGSGTGRSVIFDDPGMVESGFFIDGGFNQDVVVKSLGGDAVLSHVKGRNVSFEQGMGVMATIQLTDSDIQSFSSASSNGIDVTNMGSLGIGSVNSTGAVVFNAGNFISVQGPVKSTTSITINGSDGSYDFIELLTPLDAPIVNLNGGTGGADVDVYGTLDLNGVSLTNINSVFGASSTSNELIDSTASSTISLSTIYPPMEVGETQGEALNENEMMSPGYGYGGGETLIQISGFSGVDFLGFNEVSGGGGNDVFNIGLDMGEDFMGNVLGGADNDTFNISYGGSVGLIDGGMGTDSLNYSSFSSGIEVDLGAGTATQAWQIQGLEDFVGGAGIDSLKGTSSADQFILTGMGMGTVSYGPLASSASFSAFEGLYGEGQNDSFAINGGSVSTIDGGSEADVIDYSGETGKVSVNLGGSSSTGVTQYSGIESFKGGSGTDDDLLGTSLDDQFTISGANSGTVSYGAGPMTVGFMGFENLMGEAGADSFVMDGGTIVKISGGSQSDTIDYSSLNAKVGVNLGSKSGTGITQFDGVESFKGGGGMDDDFSGTAMADDFSITGTNSGTLSYGSGPMTVAFSGFENLHGEGGDDSFLINDGGTIGSIRGGANTDTLSFNGYSSSVEVNLGAESATQVGLFKDLEVFEGSANSDTLIGTSVADQFTLTSAGSGTMNFGPSSASGSFSAFETLRGEAGDDTFFVTGGSITTIDGGGNTDAIDYSGTNAKVTVDIGNASSTGVTQFSNVENFKGGTGMSDELLGTSGQDSFLVNGAGSGTLSYGGIPTIAGFSNFETLDGKGEDDSFLIGDAGMIGSVVGGSGSNSLDYRGLSGPAVVDLEKKSATGVGSFSEVENLFANGTPGGGDTILGTEMADNFAVTGSMSGTVNGLNFVGFDELAGAGEDDVFAMNPNGEIGVIDGGDGNGDTLDFSAFSTPVAVDAETASATGVDEFQNIEKAIGGSGSDSLSGTEMGDIFSITADNAGFLNAGEFSSFENLFGAGGNDQFLFSNQATVSMVNGGGAFDLLSLDDRNLTGMNNYVIGASSITRNPTYNFAGLESLNLLLGSGDDMVSTAGNGLAIFIDGGDGVDILNLTPAQFITTDPMMVGGSTITVTDFEGPFDPDNPPNLSQTGGGPSTGGPGGGQTPTDPSTLAGIASTIGNAFSAIASQTVVIGVGGSEFQAQTPLSMDGSGMLPPLLVLSNLNTNLEPQAWAELAAAIGFSGPIILVMNDGAFSVDLSGLPPEQLLPLLEESLKAAAARELAAALELNLAIPVTSIDGAVSILTVPVPIDAETLALLELLLGDDAYSELISAFDE